MYILEKEIDLYDRFNGGPAAEIAKVLNWLKLRGVPHKRKKVVSCISMPITAWETVTERYLQLRGGDRPNGFSDIHTMYTYAGKSWKYYMVYTSDKHGYEIRQSVLLMDDPVLAIEYKLAML